LKTHLTLTTELKMCELNVIEKSVVFDMFLLGFPYILTWPKYICKSYFVPDWLILQIK